MNLFDLHCDTPLELYLKNERLENNSLHVSIDKVAAFDRYVQCAAVYSRYEFSDEECFSEFLKIADDFSNKANGLIIKDREELRKSSGAGFILTVEDSRLVSGDISRISVLYDVGVRVATLLWKGFTSVGSSWDSDGSLTYIGREILEGLFDVGIIPDVSHANDTVIKYVLERSKSRNKPVIATHSNSRAVCPHKRNLTDEDARCLARCGGIVGISLYPPHLKGQTAAISDVVDHIRHYVDLCGTDFVCLGCDFDGIDKTPEGLSNIAKLPLLHNALSRLYSQDLCDKIFFYNAYNFFINNLPRGKSK